MTLLPTFLASVQLSSRLRRAGLALVLLTSVGTVPAWSQTAFPLGTVTSSLALCTPLTSPTEAGSQEGPTLQLTRCPDTIVPTTMMQLPPPPSPPPVEPCTTQMLTPAHTAQVLAWVRALVQMQLQQPGGPAPQE